MKHSSLPSWALQYLNFLGLEPEQPSIPYLESICRAHLSRLPFENISKLIYYRDQHVNGFLIPPIEKHVANIQQHNYGGTCYNINSQTLLLLQALDFSGFHVRLGEHHLGIIIRSPEEQNLLLYVDFGAAAPLFKPVPFQVDPKNSSCFGIDEIKILPDPDQPDHYRFTRFRRGEQLNNEWIFNPNHPVEFTDLADVIKAANEPGAYFMKELRCQLWQLEREHYLSLINNTFIIRTSDNQEKKLQLNSISEIEEVLSKEFLLPHLPVREAIEVLNSIGIDIFRQEQPA